MTNRGSISGGRQLSIVLIVLNFLVLLACISPANADEPNAPLISNVFADTYIVEVLKDIAYQAKVNIIPDQSVQGFITLELNDVPLEEALRLVLYPGGYLFRKVGNAYLVGAADPSSPFFSSLSVSERLKLNYINADDAKRLIGDFYSKYARFDQTTNTVFITSSPDIVERFKSDLRQIDQPPAQVVIEALVTELSNEVREALGFDWSASFGSPSLYGQPDVGLGIASGEGLIDVALKTATDLLHAKITALANDGKVTVKANPRIMVVEGRPAEIFIGKDRYYRLSASTNGTTTARLESIGVGVSLSITARVSSDGNITMQVKPEVSDVSGMVTGESLPLITRRQATTTIRTKDGETVALGGLIQQIEQTGTRRLPLLGDLPIVRNLFQTEFHNNEETEVVIFLTPRILK